MPSSRSKAKIPTFRGVPTFFRACCYEAQSGGDWSYHHPGLELARHLEGLVPYEIDATEDWLGELEELRRLILRNDDESAWHWFQQRLPRCMELVPSRRRRRFLSGVRAAVEQQLL